MNKIYQTKSAKDLCIHDVIVLNDVLMIIKQILSRNEQIHVQFKDDKTNIFDMRDSVVVEHEVRDFP